MLSLNACFALSTHQAVSDFVLQKFLILNAVVFAFAW